jgi:murein DD-endopeptidase MepM/ murein hydrolase activator NlpD
MPFNITTWLMMLAGLSLGNLTPAQNLPVVDLPFAMPQPITAFLSTFSAILFQSNPLSGLLIALAVLLYSRIALTLMTAGFLVAFCIYSLLGLDAEMITIHALSFNATFAALALGGMFLIPSAGSLSLGLLASAVAVILTVACDGLFTAPFSSLALPFNITVYIFLYALHHRVHRSKSVTLSENNALSPEANLRKHHEVLQQWKKTPIMVSLPFYGRWKVTQGIDGAFTHKENWRFAFDFQAVDGNGQVYKGDGASPHDYYAFGLPVLTPAKGRVTALKNNLPDNPIGKTNTGNNWGNYIIIEHAPGYYSCTAHLKQGSVKVIAGQDVQEGEIIAACGNSGRSPYPHIHLQFQHLPLIGSSSVSFEFSHLIVGDEQPTYLARGIVKEGSLVQNIMPAMEYSEFFPYSLNKAWTFTLISEGKSGSECWHTDLDFYGNTMLVSLPKVTKLYFHLSDGTLSVQSLSGDRTTGLALMGGLLSEIPFTSYNETLTWTALHGVDDGISPILKMFMDILSLLGFRLTALRSCTTRQITIGGNDQIMAQIKSSLHLTMPFLVLPIKALQDAEIIFQRKIGLKRLKMGGTTLEIQQTTE